MFGYFKQFVYVQLAHDRLTVRDPKTHESISEVPEVAYTKNGALSILAVGAEARSAAGAAGAILANPFAHPRSLLSDFTLAEHVLKGFLKRLRPSASLLPNATFVMHPLGEHEGGLTQIEIRVIRELALGARASEVVVWQGIALRDEQLLEGTFPPGGKVLG